MRLCGISSGFPLLSPGIRQVAHALLTRPPLGRGSLGFSAPPFDLHVLGTPPAFILSQDQTLMFNSVRQIPIWLTVFSGSGPPFWLPVLADFSQSLCPLNYPLFGESPGLRPSLPRPLRAFFLEFSGLHYCLFVKVPVASAVTRRTEKEGFEPSRRY